MKVKQRVVVGIVVCVKLATRRCAVSRVKSKKAGVQLQVSTIDIIYCTYGT